MDERVPKDRPENLPSVLISRHQTEPLDTAAWSGARPGPLRIASAAPGGKGSPDALRTRPGASGSCAGPFVCSGRSCPDHRPGDPVVSRE